MLPNVTAVIAVFENRVQNDAAIGAVLYGFQDESRKLVTLQEKYVEFSTEFTNGTEISTNNSHVESAFRKVERRRVFQLPDTTDIELLYSAHKQIVALRGTPPKRSLPKPEQWADELRENMTKEFMEQLDTGYLKMDKSNEFFVMTWKGAYLMTWKQLWPISVIRRSIRRRKARELLSAIGYV